MFITKKTKITKSQYQRAYFFISDTADHYLIYRNNDGIEKSLWVGRDRSSLKTTIDENIGRRVEGQFCTDENGKLFYTDGYMFPTSESYSNIDLEALEDGSIEWI